MHVFIRSEEKDSHGCRRHMSRELKRFRRNNNTCTCFRYQIKENSITESRYAAGEQKSEVSMGKIHGEKIKKFCQKIQEHAVPTI